MWSSPVLENDYRTPEKGRRSPVSFFPSLCFYPGMIGVVLRAAGAAKRGLYTDGRWVDDSRKIISILESAGGRVDIENVDVLKQVSVPCILVGNHMSTLETFALPSVIHPFFRITFVVKRSLVEYPVFKHVMRAVDPVIVDRENPRKDFKTVMEEGEKRIQKGVSLVVFPQSTRSTRFDPAHFNSMGVKLAKRTKVPVVPVALKTDAWANGKLLKDFGRIHPERTVHISFGPPMTVAGSGKAEHAAIIEYIQDKLGTWAGEKAEVSDRSV
ncbi:MAG: lysophospholipid acyltransferase family protein [Desulfovibrionales bacterium]